MREIHNTQWICKILKRYTGVKKIFLSPEMYLSILEENEGIIKNEGSYIWGKQCLIKYDRNKLPLWGDIPIEIDEHAGGIAICGE